MNRVQLKEYLLEEREWICDGCQKPFIVCDLHEGIVSRSDTRGLKWQKLIFHEVNCVLLCVDCNRINPPSREKIWKLQVSRYGEDVVKSWVDSLPSKTPFRRFDI